MIAAYSLLCIAIVNDFKLSLLILHEILEQAVYLILLLH